jgi:[acyl-carrier-protein] S-malonyltransferase
MGWEEMIGYLFPGQGSQYVGMGKEVWERFDVARKTFETARTTLGYDVERLCFEGPLEELSKTEYTQVAVLTTSIAIYRALESKGIEEPLFAAGHSLGEYSALVCAGALDFVDALNLVTKRATLMQEVSSKLNGGMVAILGLSQEEVEEICGKTGLEIANLNCPGQVVVSGKVESLYRCIELAMKNGAKRAVRLNVSGPFHSSYMREAGERLMEVLEKVDFRTPSIRVLSNVSADYVSHPDEIRSLLSQQVYSRVRWEEGMRRLIRDGARTFFEVGPGEVLSGLMKRISKDVNCGNVIKGGLFL